MSPRRKHANHRPAELMLTCFANTLVLMNKAKLQTQTGAGRIATLTTNIQRGKSARVTVDLLQISTICFISAFTYEWVETEREGWRWATAWMSMIPLWSGGGGAERRLPFRCPSCVQPVRERRQCWWQLATGTAGRPAVAAAREVTRRPWRVNKKCGEEIKGWLWLIKTAGPSALNEPTGDAGPRGSPAQPGQTIPSP